MTLNEKQIIAYEFICNQTADDGFAYLGDIAKAVYGDFKPLTDYPNRSAWRNQYSLKALQKDILRINKSDAQHRVAPYKVGGKLIGYKIADHDELEKLRLKYRREGIRKLIMSSEMGKAMKDNGQYRFTPDDVIKEITAYMEGR